MMNRLPVAALLALFLAGLPATAAARRGPNFIPWDQAAKIAKETGKPVAVYCIIDPNGSQGTDTVNADWSINECVKLKQCGEFIWTRCDNIKTARLVKASVKPPGIIFLDCDMEKFLSVPVSDLDSVEAALQGALDKYSSREITWEEYSEEAIKSATAKRFVILAFTTEREECTATLKAFEDRTMVKHQPRILYMQTPFVTDSEEAKRWGVAVSPAYIIIDPNQDCKVVERLQGKRAPVDLRAFLAKGFKATAVKKTEPGAGVNPK